MRRLILGFVSVGVCLVVSACSGTKESGETCGNSAGCGGDVVGTWEVTSSCLTIDLGEMMNADCPGQTTTTSGLMFSGGVTFAADMTYTSNFTVSGDVVLSLPASCLKRNNITLTCSQVTEALQADMMMGATAGSCSNATGGGCSCKLPFEGESNGESGTYTTTGSGALTQTPDNGTAETSTYCAKGSTLTLSPSGDSMVSGTLTLAKQ